MAIFSAGLLIKEFRKKRNLTQNQLCCGLCNISTLSRIEKGERQPSNYIFKHLMERLGENANKYYVNIASAAELEFFQLFDQIETKLLDSNYSEAEKLYPKLEKSYNEDVDTLNEQYEKNIKYQMLLYLKANILYHISKDKNEIQTLVKSTLDLTLQNHDLKKADTYLYSYIEISLLCLYSFILYDIGRIEESIDLLYSLMESMDRYYSDETEKAKSYLMIIYNLSKYLGSEGRYDEALEVLDSGIALSINTKRMYFLPYYYYNKGYILHHMGMKEYSRTLVIQAYYLFAGFGNKVMEDTIKLYIEKNMDFQFHVLITEGRKITPSA